LRWSLKLKPAAQILVRPEQKDQHMKIRLPLPVLAGLLSASLNVVEATTITEDFTADPLQNGWQVFGDTNQFQWDSTNHQLAVTWDSTHTNSYFYQPMGTILTRYDDFSIAFDLRLNDIASGVEAGKTGPMQLGFGFLNFTNATSTNFMRGAYGSAPNVAEFDYYAWGYYEDMGTIYEAPAATTPSFISGVDSYDYAPITISVYDNELPTNQTVHITMSYTASNQTVAVTVLTNGVPTATLPNLILDGDHGFVDTDDFHVDMFSISSYSSAGDAYDSILAHGTVGNIVVTLPPSVQNLTGSFSNGVWQVRFSDRLNWLYTLERTTNFLSWTDVCAPTTGNGTNLFLQDTNLVSDSAFYRVRAERP
jgi:hypothetical protein